LLHLGAAVYYMEHRRLRYSDVIVTSVGEKSPTHSPNSADTRLSRFLGSGWRATRN